MFTYIHVGVPANNFYLPEVFQQITSKWNQSAYAKYLENRQKVKEDSVQFQVTNIVCESNSIALKQVVSRHTLEVKERRSCKQNIKG